jgi:hypothetical protein
MMPTLWDSEQAEKRISAVEKRIELAAFHTFAIPGMSLLTEVPEGPPLIKRCKCGRQISDNKVACRACWEEFLASQVASLFPSAEPASSGDAPPYPTPELLP